MSNGLHGGWQQACGGQRRRRRRCKRWRHSQHVRHFRDRKLAPPPGRDRYERENEMANGGTESTAPECRIQPLKHLPLSGQQLIMHYRSPELSQQSGEPHVSDRDAHSYGPQHAPREAVQINGPARSTAPAEPSRDGRDGWVRRRSLASTNR